MSKEEMRVMRVVLPIEQIRRMDELILRGAGGLANRSEFISEAVEAFLLDLSFLPAEGEPAARDDVSVSSAVGTVGLQIPLIQPGYVMPTPPQTSDEPLFGLHNRDFPSIWALWRLSALAHSGPASLSRSISSVTDEAWIAGAQLERADAKTGEVIKSLFPTNRDKRDAAESAFREFAIGNVITDAGTVRTAGPLFQWGACAVESGTDVQIGLTDVGWELLVAMQGLEPYQPHSEGHARSFISLIKRHAPADWACFALVLKMADDGAPTRLDLVHAFTERLGLSSPNVASTLAAGYVARCREWGLLEPKQLKGTYAITDLGRSISKG